MTPRGRQRAIATSVGLGTLLAPLLRIPFADLLLMPGLLIASLFWPQGIHSDRFLGPVGVVLFIITIYAGTAAAWGALAYAILRLNAERRRPGG